MPPVMGFKFLRTGSFLYRTYQQQVRPLPAMGFKILRTGSSSEPLRETKEKKIERSKTKKKGQSLRKTKKQRSKTKIDVDQRQKM